MNTSPPKTIPFLDLRPGYIELKSEIDDAVARVLDGGWYILGAEVEAFEQEFAAWCGVQYAVGVANGLDALQLALLAVGVGPGDEVIVPSNTFIATWLAVSHCGAIPVAVDPNPLTFTIEAAAIEAAITPRTKAIVPVHLYGLPADLDPILAVARRHTLFVVEDAAQAQGARYKGQRLGGHGDVVSWSFYPGKNLGGMGDGGAITTNNPEIAATIAKLRNYGSPQKYVHEMQGFNSRLDAMQAAILRVKLRHLEEWNQRRKTIAACYLDGLTDTGLVLPVVPDWADPVWHLFVVRHPDRAGLQQRLTDNGVGTQVHYPIPPHRQLAYGNDPVHTRTPLLIAESMASTVLSLPIGPHLGLDQAQTVVQAVRAALSRV